MLVHKGFCINFGNRNCIAMKPRQYKFNNSTLTIVFGDLLQSKADVIVSSDDTYVSMGGGISGCILRAGGDIIRDDAQKKLPASVGDVIVSTAGALEHQKYVFHCLTLSYDGQTASREEKCIGDDLQTYILKHSIDRCFTLLHALEVQSIAFPCLGAGVARFPMEKVADIMADSISRNLCKTQKSFNVELYLYDRFKMLNGIDYIDLFEKFAIKSAFARQRSDADYGMMEQEEPAAEALATQLPHPQEMNHKVFISYSRKDSEQVKLITQILDKHSIPYWIDKEGIYSGSNFKEVIVDAIENSRALIFVSSVNSNASLNVAVEVEYAIRLNKTILPVMLDDAPFSKRIRLDISNIDQIEFAGLHGNESKLITSLKYVLDVK